MVAFLLINYIWTYTRELSIIVMISLDIHLSTIDGAGSSSLTISPGDQTEIHSNRLCLHHK